MISQPNSGLSPRVRGTSRTPVHSGVTPGLSPACAGEPAFLHFMADCYRVYPRVCGGTTVGSVFSGIGGGLSPRVRGNRNRREPEQLRAAVYPRVSGGTYSATGLLAAWGVYPRVCGGTGSSSRGFDYWSGLSPRVRGNPSSWMPLYG